MTRHLLLASATLLATSLAVGAATTSPNLNSDSIAGWEHFFRAEPDLTMGVGDPHGKAAETLAIQSDKAVAAQEQAEIQQWASVMGSGQPWPNMGVGGHGG